MRRRYAPPHGSVNKKPNAGPDPKSQSAATQNGRAKNDRLAPLTSNQ
ncbi:MAG TPA: hypothetical protein PKI49_05415 [Pseudomonadota bacterium]|nr:hypothetical protein [Pseudomonadota bacterium]HNO67928.1 hypothetical protein [Pseudomonadota bacterium]